MSDQNTFAVIKCGGKQYKVGAGHRVLVDRLPLEVGAEVSLKDVLLLSKGDGDTVTVGAPIVSGAEVTGRVVSHLRGPKVTIFKKRRRQGYKKKLGHRQELTEIEIESING